MFIVIVLFVHTMLYLIGSVCLYRTTCNTLKNRADIYIYIANLGVHIVHDRFLVEDCEIPLIGTM